MNNLIIVKGNTYSEIKRLLQELHTLPLYAVGVKENFDIELHQLRDDLLAIRVNKQLNIDFFTALLYYLDDPEYSKHKADIKGYITALDTEEFRNKKLMMYVPKNRLSIVNVVTNTDENYKIDFDYTIDFNKFVPRRVISTKSHTADFRTVFKSEISRLDNKPTTYQYPDINLTSQPEIIPVVHIKEPRKLTKKEKTAIEKIDKTIYYLAILLALLIGYVVFSIFR